MGEWIGLVGWVEFVVALEGIVVAMAIAAAGIEATAHYSYLQQKATELEILKMQTVLAAAPKMAQSMTEMEPAGDL